MELDQARKLISRLFSQAVDDIDTDRLQRMSHEIEAQMKEMQVRGLHQKVLDALETEIQARERFARGRCGDVQIHIDLTTRD